MQNKKKERICFTLLSRAGSVASIIRNILEYIDQKKQVLWTIMGFGPEEQKFKQKRDKNDRVNWTGKLTNQEILSLYPKQ